MSREHCPCRKTGELCDLCERVAEDVSFFERNYEPSGQQMLDAADREARW